MRTNLYRETRIRCCVAYITGRNYVDSQAKCKSMGGDNHGERATFRSGNGMLELLDMMAEMECSPSGVHRAGRDRGESRVYCNFNRELLSQWRHVGCEADLQSRPAVKSFSNPEARTTTLTSSSRLTVSNTLEYSRQTLEGLRAVNCKRLDTEDFPIPFVERIHWCSVHLDEIYVGSWDGYMEEFAA